MYSHLTSI